METINEKMQIATDIKNKVSDLNRLINDARMLGLRVRISQSLMEKNAPVYAHVDETIEF